MLESLKPNLKEIATIVNNYASSKKYSEIETLEKYFATLFEAEIVKFWKVDSENETLELMDKEKRDLMSLDSSLIQQAIESKKSLLENHVTSDKYYNQVIDNPLSLKVKALMLLPVLKGKKVIGVLKIWRGVRQRKVFNKKDEEKLQYFIPLVLKVFEANSIEKDELMTLLGEKEERITKRIKASPKVKKEIKKEIKKIESVSEDKQLLSDLKKKFDEISNENKTYSVNEKKQNKIIHEYESKCVMLEEECIRLEKQKNDSQNKENELVFQTKIDKYDKELEASEVKYKELEVSSFELYSESQIHQNTIKELEKELKLMQKENAYLNTDLKEKNTKSIKEMKSEKSMLSVKKSSEIDDNIELVLKHVDNDFSENEYAYMLFEMMLYALYSKKGISYIEESIKKSKIVPNIIDGYYFKGDIQVHNEKYRISDLVEHIKMYEKNIFAKMIKLDISVDEMMPSSLVFDAAKIQSIILHLLVDLHQFVDHNHPVNINFTFKKKFLNVEIGGSIHKKNSLFQTMFKQTKLAADEKDRIGLQLSKKIISRLKGEIDYLYEDDYYKFILTVPTQVIKM
jgi:hypothetical protein